MTPGAYIAVFISSSYTSKLAPLRGNPTKSAYHYSYLLATVANCDLTKSCTCTYGNSLTSNSTSARSHLPALPHTLMAALYAARRPSSITARSALRALQSPSSPLFLSASPPLRPLLMLLLSRPTVAGPPPALAAPLPPPPPLVCWTPPVSVSVSASPLGRLLRRRWCPVKPSAILQVMVESAVVVVVVVVVLPSRDGGACS